MKIPVPEALDLEFATIARTEFRGVDELHPSGMTRLDRCFGRFRNEMRGQELTWDRWRGKWRDWLVGDFVADGSGQATDGHANGPAPAANGHDPPSARRGKGYFADFAEAGFRTLETISCRKLNFDEKVSLRRQLLRVFEGEEVEFGLATGLKMTPDEVFAELPEFDALAGDGP